MTNNTANDFMCKIFDFIYVNYGDSTVNSIKERKNKKTVDNIIANSTSQGYSVEKTANKIVAMLRLNP